MCQHSVRTGVVIERHSLAGLTYVVWTAIINNGQKERDMINTLDFEAMRAKNLTAYMYAWSVVHCTFAPLVMRHDYTQAVNRGIIFG